MPGWPFRLRLGACRGLRGAEGQPTGGRRKSVNSGARASQRRAQPFLPLRRSTQRPCSRSSAPDARPGSAFTPLTEMPRCSSCRRASPCEVARPVRRSTGTRSTPGLERLARRQRRGWAPPPPPRPARPATPARGSAPKSTSLACSAAAAASGPWTSVGDPARQHPLGLAAPGLGGVGLHQRRRPSAIGQQGELGEHPPQLGVVGVDPVLEERVRRRPLGVEPDPGAGGLADLGAVGGGEQRPAQRVHRGPVPPADQVDPGEDVAPLVGAADLQLAALVLVQVA